MRRAIVVVMLCLATVVAAPSAVAAGGGGGGGAGGGDEASRATAPEVAQAVAAIELEQYELAIATLKPYVERSRNDADGHNWLAYAYRKTGRLDAAFTHYRRALAIDPVHLGAHEYIGEAYLMVGKPAEADFHLRELERLCSAQCEQYLDLKQAIASHRGGATAPRASK